MDMKQLLTKLGLFPAVLLTVLAGCASAPEQPDPEPVSAVDAETAPVQDEEPLVLQPDYPQQYVVVKGDTLWDISGKFLRDPWHWPRLWQKNPQIANPHLIYPGDVLTLVYVDGRPALQVQRDGVSAVVPIEGAPGRYPTVKLHPQVRVQPLEEAIPVITADVIQPFLSKPRVVTADELKRAPYVVSVADEHMAAGAGFRLYVRGIDDPNASDWTVYRAGEAYRSPEGEILGYEALHVGDANVERFADPSTVFLAASKREVLVGDRLMPPDGTNQDLNFYPRTPKEEVRGSIISVVDGVTQIGQYQVVVLDLGSQQGMEKGMVLGVFQKGERIKDQVKGGRVTLPTERAGVAMVFRVFDRVSYALVMNAIRPIRVLDVVTNP